MPGVVFQTNADCTHLFFVNKAYEDIFGRSRESLHEAPRSFLEAVHPEDRARLEAAFAQGLKTGRLNEEFRIVRPDGSVRWVLDRITSIRDAEGRVARLVGNIQDITGRKRAEEALRQSEARNRALLSAIPDLMFLLSAEGVFLDYHAPDPRLLLAPPEAFLGKSYADVLPAHLTRTFSRLMDQALMSPEPQDMEYEVSLSGEARQFEGRIVACDRDRLLFMSRDITQRKQAEEALRQAQKLESLEALAGGIAHDFNNILSAILGQASLGLGKLPQGSTARAHVVKVIDAAERAAEIARKMLDFSGHGSIHTRSSDLNHVIEESRSLLEAALPKQVSLRWELSRGLPRVKVDTGQVQHALVNLALNAAEAIGEEGGHLTVATHLATVSVEDSRFWRHTGVPLDPGPFVILRVEDDGPGIEVSTQARVFEPFFTTKFTGRGLGLSVVLGVMRGHGGGVALESRPGNTRFELAFPVSGEAAQAPVRALPFGRAVLVVDDEAIVRDAVVAILTSEAVPVKGARSGEDAVAMLREAPGQFALVVLDFSMPGMGGVQTYELIRVHEPDIPVVLSSGFTEEEALRRFAGLALAGFLQKPYKPAELLEYVRRFVPVEGS